MKKDRATDIPSLHLPIIPKILLYWHQDCYERMMVCLALFQTLDLLN